MWFKIITIWDANSYEEIAYRDSGKAVTGNSYATYNPDGSRILLANNGVVTNLNAGLNSFSIIPAIQNISHLSYRPDGEYLLAANSYNGVLILNTATKQFVAGIPVHLPMRKVPLVNGAFVNSRAYSPDGKRIVVAFSDKTAWVWNIE
jgi:WD40 repeat protein